MSGTFSVHVRESDYEEEKKRQLWVARLYFESELEAAISSAYVSLGIPTPMEIRRMEETNKDVENMLREKSQEEPQVKLREELLGRFQEKTMSVSVKDRIMAIEKRTKL